MNYYIDFDNTLYETANLTQAMLTDLAQNIAFMSGENQEKIFEELKSKFNRENIYNIYRLAETFGKLYNVDSKVLIDSVEKVILNGKKYVYDDSIDFLIKLKNDGNTVNLFTYVSQEDLTYQLLKIKGSCLANYFDNIIITTSEQKEYIDIGYEKSIFIDDNPDTLVGLAKKNPKYLIRIRRKNNKYSVKDVSIDGLIEIESLKDFMNITF